jgi:hypothetical protein
MRKKIEECKSFCEYIVEQNPLNNYENILAHIEFINAVSRDKWEALRRFIESLYQAKREEERRAKIIKAHQIQNPKRDKNSDIKKLEDAIEVLEYYGNCLYPRESIYWEGTEDSEPFDATRESLNRIAGILSSIIWIGQDNKFYYPALKTYNQQTKKTEKMITQDRLNKKLIEIITTEEIDRLGIKQKVNELSINIYKVL